MSTEAPTPIVIPLRCAPKKAPCPQCGKHGTRKRAAARWARTVAYKAIADPEITGGEYRARCDCCTTFRMRRFLQNLRTWGLSPEVVVTDGSNLYTAVLAELWPGRAHQLCVFHAVRTQSRTEAARRRPLRLVPLSTS